MSKLSYTWYPKDWSNDEAVFELLLSERGMFRELIDMAMLNDNKTIINYKVWCRKFAIKEEDLERILITLSDLKLIEINDNKIFIPSCEKRLKLVRAGRSGGQKSKPNVKQNVKPTPKQKTKQKKVKEKESKDNVYKSFAHLSISKEECNKLYYSGYSVAEINSVLESIENYKNNKNYVSLFLTAKKWLEREYGKRKDKPKELDAYGNEKLDFGTGISKV